MKEANLRLARQEIIYAEQTLQYILNNQDKDPTQVIKTALERIRDARRAIQPSK